MSPHGSLQGGLIAGLNRTRSCIPRDDWKTKKRFTKLKKIIIKLWLSLVLSHVENFLVAAVRPLWPCCSGFSTPRGYLFVHFGFQSRSSVVVAHVLGCSAIGIFLIGD